jgi:sorting nexin-9/18/33
MANTLPRPTKSPSSSSFLFHTNASQAPRPASEFDAGINTSAAWTESLESSSSSTSLSGHRPQGGLLGLNFSFDNLPLLGSSSSVTNAEADVLVTTEEPEEEDEPTRRARALYDFEGKAEFRELSVAAGEEIDVIKQDLADGWSLVRRAGNGIDEGEGEVGLLPASYYTVCRISVYYYYSDSYCDSL